MPEIKLKFDANKKPIEPTVVLATRSCDKLGAIIANDLVVKGSLKNGYEISFIANKASNPNWDMISDLKLVWIPEWDIWFEISVKVNETNYLYKDVLGTSLGEAELSQIIIRNTEINTETDIARSDYEPTIIYNSDDPSASLIHRLMEKAPHYKVSHIDKSLAKLQRTFTFDKKSLRDCLNEVAEEIDGLIIIDSGSAPDGSIQRSISMYDLKRHCDDCGQRLEDNVSQCPKCGSTNIADGYGEDSGIFVCSENLSNNIDLETNVGAVKNCFKLEAGDDVMTAAITACCPNGSGYLWYISDETRADMSKDLRTKLAAYDNALSEVESRTFNLIDSISADTLSQYNTIAVKYNKNSLGTINGYTNLQTAIYDIIDFGLYIEHGMMPSGGIPATTAAEQLTNLVNNLSPVSVQRLQGLSSTTASSYITQAVRAIIDPRYSVTIDNATLDGTSWNGDIAITSYSDKSDTASYENFSVSLNENYTEYVKKLIDRILNTKEYLEFDIVALFKLNNTEFADKIKEYSLVSLKTFFDACQACLNIMIERSGMGSNSELGSLYSEYYSKQGLLQNEISVREHEAKVIENIQKCLLSIVTDVHNELDFEKYLGNELWTEFSAYRREDTYRNENYISDGLDNAQLLEKAMEFIKAAQQEITVAGTAQYNISSTLYNLLAMPEFKGVSDNFKLGNWIRIRVDNKIYMLRLIEYSLRFDSLETISVTYSDVTYNGTIGQDIDDIKSLQDSYKSMASSYGSVSKQASKGNDTNNQLRSWVSDGLEVSKVRFLDDAVNQNMTWSKNGMLFRKYDEVTEDYSPEQLKIINSTIAVTDSNWETVKTAIGGFDYLDPVDNTVKHGYGINAELLIGKLILGEELGLYNKSNSLSFNDNGLKISNGKNTFAVNPNGESEVLSLSKKDTQGIDRKLLWTDDNGELNIRVKSFSLTGVNGDKNLEDIIEETKGLQMVLTNEYKGVPTDCDGNYTGSLSVQTSVKVYYGHMDVTDTCVYTTETSQGVVGNWDNENKSYIVTTLTDDSGWVDITAAYSGLTVTKRFNLSKIRAGATGSDGAPGANGADGKDGRNYFIETSVNTIKCDSDGTVTPSNLIVYSYYTEGNSSTKYAAPTTFKAYTVGREDTEYYYSEWDSFHSQIEIDLTEWVSNDTAYIEIESGNGSKTIPVITPIIDTMTQEDIFNKLTNNGETQGLYLQDGKVYINAEYIKSGTISAIDIEGCNISATAGDWVAKYNASGMSFWDSSNNVSKFSINRYESFTFGSNNMGNLPCIRADYLPVMGTNESGYYNLMLAPNGLPSFDGTPYGIPGVMWINGGHGINMSSFSQTSNDQYQNRLICGNLVYPLSNGVQMYPVVINESLFSNTMITSTLYTQNLNVTGSKYRVVATDTYGVVSMNAVESATPMFIDIGSGNVGSDGKIDILYDEKFSETVDTICESQVFITPTSAKKISYIEKHSGYFTVYGDADATFDWIIYCPQKGYTTERMESAVCPDNANVPNVDETIFEQNSSADFATQEDMNEYTNISQNLLEEGENNS